MTEEEKESAATLSKHLHESMPDQNKRDDLENFILALYFQVIKKYSETKFSMMVDHIIHGGEYHLYVPHIPKSEDGPDPKILRNDFLKEIFGLCSFTFGPDSEGEFTFEPGTADNKIEKYFFSELGSFKMVSTEINLDEEFLPSALVSEINFILKFSSNP